MVNQRERQVKIDELSDEQVANISKKIGDKLSEIINQATEEANKILNIYGLETRIQFLEPYPKGTQPSQEE